MDDIFYLNTKKISVKDVKKVAEKLKVNKVFIPKTSDVLEIQYCDGIYASWFEMSVDDFQEPDDRNFLYKNKIVSIFCISYHPKDLEFILPHIKCVLKEYGGWIGNDSERFQPLFDIKNIDSFFYQVEEDFL
ncbi:hypothetical protein ABCY62_02125 [Acetivibrio clariflavus]|uniref:hypothetical protein n=1 Tax=Acetivibrio clariflavus TaxID=288965 RepID=UPI0031F49EEE